MQFIRKRQSLHYYHKTTWLVGNSKTWKK